MHTHSHNPSIVASLRRRIIQALIACLIIQTAAYGEINLDLRPLTLQADPGTEIGIQLYATSDSTEDQLMAAADVILGWDPDYLQFLGNDTTGAVPLWVSGFPNPDPYGINEVVPPQDGDGFYLAYALGGQPVVATPEGALLTTFRFLTLAETPETEVLLLTSAGDPTGYTAVYDGTTPGLIVTGTLGSSLVSIQTCGDGDVNGDGSLNVDDILPFVEVLLGTDTDPEHIAAADVDCSGLANGADVQGFVNILLG